MATPDTCVFDLEVPRRPGLDDTGGGQKEDDQAQPPNPLTMLTANDMNQWAELLVRYGSVVPLVILSIHYAAGTPAITSLASVFSSALTPDDFDLTDNGTGDVSVTWDAGIFPARTVEPEAIIGGATAGFATCTSETHGVNVLTSGTGGSAADLNFNLHIYGD
jgi:hypothetical protein